MLINNEYMIELRNKWVENNSYQPTIGEFGDAFKMILNHETLPSKFDRRIIQAKSEGINQEFLDAMIPAFKTAFKTAMEL